MNQAKFAELLGVSRNTIVKIENGQMKLPTSLAYRCKAATGCDLRQSNPDSFREGPLEICATWNNGKKYTREVFDEFRSVYSHPRYLDALKRESARRIALILDRASEVDLVPTLSYDLAVFCAKTLSTYDWGDLREEFLKPLDVGDGEIVALNLEFK